MKKLIIIHGWTYTIEPWSKTVEILRADGVDVRQLRVPGLTTKSDKVWTINDYVSWLREEIKDERDITVLGHSNGGRIAMHYLTKFPNGFKQLILLNSAGVFYKPEADSLKRRVARVVAKVGKPLSKIPGLRKVFYRIIGSDYGRAPENMKKTLSNMLDSDKTFDASGVQADRVDILWGKEDRVTPAGLGQLIKKSIPNASFQAVDEWAHAPYITHPEQLASKIKELL